MITLTNGHRFEYLTASGALAYDGKGWWHEQPYRWCGLIKPELFTHVAKTLTIEPIVGNLRWYWPFSCIKWLKDGGLANKVAHTNPGIDWWCREVGPKVRRSEIPLIVSLYGTPEELVAMTYMVNSFDIVGIEVSTFCPNREHRKESIEYVVRSVKQVREVSRHPVLFKVSHGQEYVEFARQLLGYGDAININSVPWDVVFPSIESPLAPLPPNKGGGGVSGKPAQKFNWPIVEELAREVPELPVIAPSVMQYEDLKTVRELGARAIAFGTIHIQPLWNSYKPTQIVQQDMAAQGCDKNGRILPWIQ